MIETTFSTIIQLFVFSLVPFVIYWIKNKSVKGFWEYIGLKKSTKKANLFALLVMLLLAAPVLMLSFLNPEFQEIMINPESVSGKIRSMEFGLEAIFTILMVALIKTSLSEEIFFRGFLAKRLIAATNFRIGNFLQAIVFGAVHSLLFMGITSNILFLAILFFFPALFAYCVVFLNEKFANGSIFPGWIAHGSANVVSYAFIAFFV